MVHVYSIKFPFLSCAGGNTTNIGHKSLNITLVEVPSFSVVASLVTVTSSYCKYSNKIPYNVYSLIVVARIWASLGSILVHYFSATVLLNLSVLFLISSPISTYVPVYQPFSLFSINYWRLILSLIIDT